jgi:hypothetical protein
MLFLGLGFGPKDLFNFLGICQNNCSGFCFWLLFTCLNTMASQMTASQENILLNTFYYHHCQYYYVIFLSNNNIENSNFYAIFYFLVTLSLIIPWYETQTLFASVVLPSN